MKYFILFFIGSLLFSNTAYSASFYDNARKKQEKKDAQRWSLSQWLEQKQKIKLMDTWLMYNAPSPYEFFFGADTSSFDQINTQGNNETSQSFRNYRGSFGAYVTMVGLYGEYESSDEDISQWKAKFMVRVLGSSDQSTNLVLSYGLMNRDFNGDKTQYQVAGGQLNFYIVKAFALTGMYEHYLEAESEQNDITSSGHRIEGGAHIEYGALRIYGTWFQENMDLVDPSLIESKRTREGILFGTRIYF